MARNSNNHGNETLETEALVVLAEKIARYATEADERTIEAAKLIREARKRVEAEVAGGHCHVNRTYTKGP